MWPVFTLFEHPQLGVLNLLIYVLQVRSETRSRMLPWNYSQLCKVLVNLHTQGSHFFIVVS